MKSVITSALVISFVGMSACSGSPSVDTTTGVGGSHTTGGAPSTGGAVASGGTTTTSTGGSCAGSYWIADTSTAGQLKLAFGSGTNFPQYGVLYTDSTYGGYLRFVYGPSGGWGTSIIVSPSFWTSDGAYHQGTALSNVRAQTSCSAIQVTFDGTVGGLSFSGTLNVDPPANNQVTARVSMTTSGTVTLASGHPGEAFKPVMLSSMHESDTSWDAQSAMIDGIPLSFPLEQWVVTSPITATHFGVIGGTSSWKANSPSVAIVLAGIASPSVTGWVSSPPDTNPNNDNVGLWAATSEVRASWSYDITVTP